MDVTIAIDEGMLVYAIVFKGFDIKHYLTRIIKQRQDCLRRDNYSKWEDQYLPDEIHPLHDYAIFKKGQSKGWSLTKSIFS